MCTFIPITVVSTDEIISPCRDCNNDLQMERLAIEQQGDLFFYPDSAIFTYVKVCLSDILIVTDMMKLSRYRKMFG